MTWKKDFSIMRRFNTSLIDLMTVLLLTVMVLISGEGRPATQSGNVEQAFVMVSGRLAAEHGKIDSIEWRDGTTVVAKLTDLSQPSPKMIDDSLPDHELFASLDFHVTYEDSVSFAAYRTSDFREPGEMSCHLQVFAPANLDFEIIGLNGLESVKHLRLPRRGKYVVSFTTKRIGNGTITAWANSRVDE